jgi:hypothetical protein
MEAKLKELGEFSKCAVRGYIKECESLTQAVAVAAREDLLVLGGKE